MPGNTATLPVILLAGLLLIGCRGQGTATPPPTREPATAPPETPRSSPEESALGGLVVDFLLAVSAHDEMKARRYLAPDYSRQIPDLPRALGDPRAPDQVQLTASTLAGDEAMVQALLQYPNRTGRVTVRLERRNSRWQITDIAPTDIAPV